MALSKKALVAFICRASYSYSSDDAWKRECVVECSSCFKVIFTGSTKKICKRGMVNNFITTHFQGWYGCHGSSRDAHMRPFSCPQIDLLSATADSAPTITSSTWAGGGRRWEFPSARPWRSTPIADFWINCWRQVFKLRLRRVWRTPLRCAARTARLAGCSAHSSFSWTWARC